MRVPKSNESKGTSKISWNHFSYHTALSHRNEPAMSRHHECPAYSYKPPCLHLSHPAPSSTFLLHSISFGNCLIAAGFCTRNTKICSSWTLSQPSPSTLHAFSSAPRPATRPQTCNFTSPRVALTPLRPRQPSPLHQPSFPGKHRTIPSQTFLFPLLTPPATRTHPTLARTSVTALRTSQLEI